MRAWLAPLAFSLLFLPTRGEAASLRCGSDLISDGASKADVLLKCGEPMLKETRIEYEGVKQKYKSPDVDTTAERVVQKTIDEWTYNFGAQRFIQVVVFENGKLVDVRSGTYGR
jgi:Protein of unknown function (DUF2845)